MTTHTVSSEAFDALAAGVGEFDGVLRSGQRSKRLLLLYELTTTVARLVPRLYELADSGRSWSVLVDAHRSDRAAVDELLLQPHVGAWAKRCLRLLVTGEDLAPADLGHLGAVAAAAALLARRSCDVKAYLSGGSVMLPTFGLVRVGHVEGWCRLRSTGRGHRAIELDVDDMALEVVLDRSSASGSTWWPLRRLTSVEDGLALRMDLDDVDPARCSDMLTAGPRMTDADVSEWQAKQDGAWSLLVREHRRRAEAIAFGPTAYVPLEAQATAAELSATRPEALGAVAMTPPRSALALALALAHEFQHLKLAALLDLVPLLEGSDERYYAPWRPDPRPLNGLLQGAYAYLGLTEFWDTHRRGRAPNTIDRDLADFEFAVRRQQVPRALRTLRASGRLTALGARFVSGMSRGLGRFDRSPVPRRIGFLARVACIDNDVTWRVRNVRPDPGQVTDWVDLWVRGQRFPGTAEVRRRVVDGEGGGVISLGPSGRMGTIRNALGRPAGASHNVELPEPGDRRLTAGDLRGASEVYRTRLENVPDEPAAWSGLAVVRHFIHAPSSHAFESEPELVRAVHNGIWRRTGVAPNPDEVAAWISVERRPSRVAP